MQRNRISSKTNDPISLQVSLSSLQTV